MRSPTSSSLLLALGQTAPVCQACSTSSAAFFRISATRLSAGSSGPRRHARLKVAAAGEVADRLPHPIDDLVEQVAMFLEIALALGGDVVDLLPVGLDHPDVTLVLQQLKCGIDSAGRGRVVARQLLLERLDDLVAV